jgi:HEAT repeat protein
VNRFSLSVLLTSIACSFAAGFGLAWQMHDGDQAQVNAAAPAAQAQSGQAPAGVNQNPWSKSASASSPYRSGYEGAAARPAATLDEQKMREQALADPVALRSLIQRFETETNPGTRESLKSVLMTIDKPEAIAFVTRLATSNDVAKRQEAFEMLQNAPDSPQIRNVLKQALTTEQTPALLTQAIVALKPAAVDPSESEAIVGQLRGLTQHADPGVRSQSILQLGQWDKTGSGQDRYAQALTDPVPQVRQAAIFAIAQSGVRSDGIKAGLISMINSPSESREVKGSALQALERFSLSKEEYASFSQARAGLGS